MGEWILGAEVLTQGMQKPLFILWSSELLDRLVKRGYAIGTKVIARQILPICGKWG